MATASFPDINDDPTTIELPLAPGRAAASASKPVVLSTEDKASIDAITTKLSADPATQTTLAALNTKIPASPATAGNQTTANTSLASIDGKIPSSPATAGNQSTANTSLASIDSKLPASPATAGNQTTANTSLASIDSKLPALPATAGNQTTANTSLASIDSKLPASPATAGNQATGNTSLASIDGKLPALSGGLVPVTVGSSISALPLPTGASTSALQSSIATLITSLTALFPSSIGAKAASASLSVTPSTDASFAQGAPRFTSGTIVSATTDATGTAYVAYGSQACTALDIVNTHPLSVDIEVRRGGSGSTVPVPAGSTRMFVAITNANQLQIRRIDLAIGQVAVSAEAFA